MHARNAHTRLRPLASPSFRTLHARGRAGPPLTPPTPTPTHPPPPTNPSTPHPPTHPPTHPPMQGVEYMRNHEFLQAKTFERAHPQRFAAGSVRECQWVGGCEWVGGMRGERSARRDSKARTRVPCLPPHPPTTPTPTHPSRCSRGAGACVRHPSAAGGGGGGGRRRGDGGVVSARAPAPPHPPPPPRHALHPTPTHASPHSFLQAPLAVKQCLPSSRRPSTHARTRCEGMSVGSCRRTHARTHAREGGGGALIRLLGGGRGGGEGKKGR